MRYFLLAGEASGDQLGGLLLEQLLRLDPEAEVRFWGGERMAAASGTAPGRHVSELAFMGFAEVAVNLPTILRLMREARRTLREFRPDVFVGIDYPGMNLRLAAYAKTLGVRAVQYVSPQAWAWRPGRVHRIARVTDRVLCVLPFEPAFYASYGYEATYTGNPLPARVDAYDAGAECRVYDAEGSRLLGERERVLLLLPGSREQEVTRMLPVMLRALGELRATVPAARRLRPVIAAAPVLSNATLSSLCADYGVGYGRDAYALMARAELACSASGTATLETALFGVPQVVCYRGNALSIALARRLVRVAHISLVNLILDGPVVPELIQGECTPEWVAHELAGLLAGDARQRQLAAYEELRERLLPYEAAAHAAEAVLAEARSGYAARGY